MFSSWTLKCINERERMSFIQRVKMSEIHRKKGG